MIMKNSTYWKKRSVDREIVIQRNSERVIRQVSMAYDKAISDINLDIEKVFSKYAKDGGLSITEAKQLLNGTESKEVLDALKEKISAITDPKVRRDILNRINAPAYSARLTRLKALKENVNVECARLADIEVHLDSVHFANTLKEGYYRTIFDIQQGIGYGFDFALLPQKSIEQALMHKWKGKNFSKRVWNNVGELGLRAQKIIEGGIQSGASVPKMAQELEDLSLIGKHAAVRLIHTETNYFMNQGELESYKEAGIDKYEYLATLDLKTSSICASLDGIIFDVEKACAGKNYPPMHPYCRSTTIPSIEGNTLTGLKRCARGENGESILVPADMKFEEWREKYTYFTPTDIPL